MSVPNAPAMTELSETNVRTATVPVGQIFQVPSIVDSISVAVQRASGTIVFQHFRMLSTPLNCRFTVIAQYVTDQLTATGWQRVRPNTRHPIRHNIYYISFQADNNNCVLS